MEFVIRGDEQLGAVVFVIVLAVAVVFVQAVAYFQDEVFGNGQVAVIKEGMEIGAEQNAVGDIMGAIQGVWLDMGSLEHGQRLFAADSAAAVIGIRHQDAESALAKAMLCHALGIFDWVCRRHGRLVAQPVHHLLIYARTFANGGIVLFADDRACGPVVGLGDPLRFIEKEGLGENDAADVGECGVDPVLLPVGRDPAAELLIVFGAVLFAEGFPSQVNGHRGIADEEAPADDGIIGLFELEQKQVIGLESMKGCAAWPPEVDLVNVYAFKGAVPIIIG